MNNQLEIFQQELEKVRHRIQAILAVLALLNGGLPVQHHRLAYTKNENSPLYRELQRLFKQVDFLQSQIILIKKEFTNE